MPTRHEVDAAAKALRERREESRTKLTAWPDIMEEVWIVLDAAEKVRAVPRGPGKLPKTKLKDVSGE